MLLESLGSLQLSEASAAFGDRLFELQCTNHGRQCRAELAVLCATEVFARIPRNTDGAQEHVRRGAALLLLL